MTFCILNFIPSLFFDTFEFSFFQKDLFKMDNLPGDRKIPEINVEKVLKSKNPALGKVIPSFLINYLKRIVHQEELNAFLKESGHLKDAELVEAALKYMKISFIVYNRENIPESGRYIFVSNHPLGGLDGLVFINELSKYFKELKFPVNDILLNIENMSGIFLAVNKHGSLDRSAVRKIEEAYESDSQILYFPAGLCSRRKRGNNKRSYLA